ncbi:hypothetical protein [Streptomyces sp. NPDC003327]
MTTAEGGWKTAVRDRLAAGRLLPLGAAADGAWITERAAREVLGRAASAVRDVVPGAMRVGPGGEGGSDGGPERAGDPPLPVPPSGLPPGPLRITAAFGAVAGRPVPDLAAELRGALFAAAADGLGLDVTEVDLRVTELLDAPPPPPSAPSKSPMPPSGAPSPASTSPATDDPLALAVLAVAGVAAVTDTFGPPVHRGPGGEVRVELAVTAGRRALDVARAARAAVTAAAPEATAVTVLVSDVR